MWLPLLLAALLIAADQWLKAWAIAHLQLQQPPIVALPGVLEWVLTFNQGAAWGMLSSGTTVLAIGRTLVGLGILAYLVARPQRKLVTLCLTLIAAGAIGNAIDGLRLGKVTDMIHAPFLSAITQAINGTQFPIFNLADSCVVSGTLLLLLFSFLPERKEKEREAVNVE